MSSAKNHAKRSHRSEHATRSCINTSARKMYVKQAYEPKRIGFFARLMRKARKPQENAN